MTRLPLALAALLAACAGEPPCVDDQGYESGGGGELSVTVDGLALRSCNAVVLFSGASSEVVATATRGKGGSEESWGVDLITNMDASGGEVTCTQLEDNTGCFVSWVSFIGDDYTCAAVATTWDESAQGPLGSIEYTVDTSGDAAVGHFSATLEPSQGCDGPVELSGSFDVPPLGG